MNDATVERADRGTWAIVATLSLVGTGLAVGSRLAVAGAVIPLAYAGAAALGTTGTAPVRIRREISIQSDGDGAAAFRTAPGDDGNDRNDDPRAGDPGDVVSVRTTVENAGEEPIVDLRVADGVPATLPVVGGSARACVALDPGETATLAYDLELDRGDHAFGGATVRRRDLTGVVVETWTASVEGDDAVRCAPVVDRVPLGSGRNDYAGEVPADEGGSGVEFYSVREYEPGDPVGSIDWRRYASTRDLATVEFRAERATRIVCVVDARSSQLTTPPDSGLTAAELSADAAERTLETLVAAGHPTGVVTLQDRNLTIVSPGTDAATRERATDLLQSTKPGAVSEYSFGWRRRNLVDELARSLPGEAQVYVFSAFVDDDPVDLVERLRVRGYPVRVVSPDVARGDGTDGLGPVEDRLDAVDASAGIGLAALARRNRLGRVRATGARVVDWDLDRPLGPVLHEAIGEGASR